MSHEILINVTPQETRVAMLEQGVVQELHVERSSARGLVGNIYLGRVARVLPGMQSAFIEHLAGSYSGVMGLPLFETAELLQSLGFPVL